MDLPQSDQVVSDKIKSVLTPTDKLTQSMEPRDYFASENYPKDLNNGFSMAQYFSDVQYLAQLFNSAKLTNRFSASRS